MNLAAEQIRALQLQIADQLEIVTASSIHGTDDIDAALRDEAIAAIGRTNTLVERSSVIIESFCS
jgi:hypothetical protein